MHYYLHNFENFRYLCRWLCTNTEIAGIRAKVLAHLCKTVPDMTVSRLTACAEPGAGSDFYKKITAESFAGSRRFRNLKTALSAALQRVTGSAEIGLDEVLELGSGDEAGVLCHHLAVLEEGNGRYAPDAACGGELLVLVNVYLGEYHAVSLLCDFLEYRTHRAAGTAPGCPEIDNGRDAFLYGLVLEVGVCDMDDFAHFLSPVWLDASGSGMSACLWLISRIFYKQVRQ